MKTPTRAGAIIGIIGVLSALAFIPTTQTNIRTWGMDAYKYHKPLFGQRNAEEKIELEHPLTGIGALLVDMRREGDPADVVVVIVDENDEIISREIIPGDTIIDDRFEFTELTQKIPMGQTVTIRLEAPNATAKNPIGIRFHPEEGLALALKERVPAWQAFITLTKIHPDRTKSIIFALMLAALAALSSTIRNRRTQIGILIVIALAAIAWRISLIPSLKGVSGGDPYNYLAITKEITQLDNPFANVKRLPGLPLLLVPAYLTGIDDIWIMRLINIGSAGICTVLLALLARTLRLPWSIQVGSAALLAVQKDFFWTSLRPEPYTLYTLLLILSLLLFFNLKTKTAQIAFGLVLGYAAMTRQEGFVLAAVLGIAAVTHLVARGVVLRRDSRHLGGGRRSVGNEPTGSFRELLLAYLYAFSPALLLVLPFFIHNWSSYGNPIYTPYFEGERLQIVDSIEAFKDSAGATWGILATLWRPFWENLWRIPLDHPVFALAVISATVWWAYKTYRSPTAGFFERVVITVIAAGGAIAFGLKAATAYVVFSDLIPLVSAAVVLVSPVALLVGARWKGAVVVLVLCSQVLIATWFHPFPKHYQQSIPLITLALVATLLISLPAMNRRRWDHSLLKVVTNAALLFPLCISSTLLFESERLNVFIDEENEHTALDYVVYNAVQIAEELPRPIGLDQAYLPGFVYFEKGGYFFGGESVSSRQEEAEWISKFDIKTMIVTNANETFQEPHEGWQEVAHFKSEGKNEKIIESWVYKIP